jgi:hypothetical protein
MLNSEFTIATRPWHSEPYQAGRSSTYPQREKTVPQGHKGMEDFECLGPSGGVELHQGLTQIGFKRATARPDWRLPFFVFRFAHSTQSHSIILRTRLLAILAS